MICFAPLHVLAGLKAQPASAFYGMHLHSGCMRAQCLEQDLHSVEHCMTTPTSMCWHCNRCTGSSGPYAFQAPCSRSCGIECKQAYMVIVWSDKYAWILHEPTLSAYLLCRTCKCQLRLHRPEAAGLALGRLHWWCCWTASPTRRCCQGTAAAAAQARPGPACPSRCPACAW